MQPLSFDNLWPLVQAAGFPAILIALLVLVIVFLAQYTDLLKNPTMRRAAVVVLSWLFSGAPNGDVLEALKFAIGAVAATLLKLGIDYLFSLRSDRAQQAFSDKRAARS